MPSTQGSQGGKTRGARSQGVGRGGLGFAPSSVRGIGVPHLPECALSAAGRESRSDAYTLPWGVKIIPAESRPVGWLGKGSNVLTGTSCGCGLGGHSSNRWGGGRAFNLVSHLVQPQEQRQLNQCRGALRLPSPCCPQHELILCQAQPPVLLPPPGPSCEQPSCPRAAVAASGSSQGPRARRSGSIPPCSQ